MNHRKQLAKTIFMNALELGSEGERSDFLREQCGDDQELRREVEQLLGHCDEIEGFLDVPVLKSVDDPVSSEVIGTQIGPYKLLQQIGEGGFGFVYMAEQLTPVRRKVALKLVKPGMDSKQVIARFESERQALAMMDHPNIAKAHDAGVADNGRPYFVMELIRGKPITLYCDENRLTTRERLELFVPVCRGLQHAHQRGIIHRDVKPSNVLVSLYDGNPVPKVIDFGVAKAIREPLTEKTMFTQFGQVIGTPDYMSPEQATLNQLDVDTRSDIYGLGAVLYELLAGVPPFEPTKMRSAAFDEMLRIIREEDPQRPSLRLSTAADAATVSKQRSTEPTKLTRALHGDLDWIVMKALDKQRDRRYETANGFAEDIKRHLSNDAVLARPPSSIYKLQKFAARNRGFVMAATLLLTSLCIGLMGTSVGFVRAKQQSEIAKEERENAIESQQSAERSDKQSRRLLYNSTIQLAAQRWDDQHGSLRDVEDLLTAAIPVGDNPDLRDFCWRYQWTQLHQNVLTRPNTYRATISPSGHLVTADETGIHEWSDAGELLSNRWNGDARVSQFSRNGRWSIVRQRKEFLLIDMGEGKIVERIAGARCRFSSDGELVATWSASEPVRIWRLSASQPEMVGSLTAVGDLPWSFSIRLAPDGKSCIKHWREFNNQAATVYIDGRTDPLTWKFRSVLGQIVWSADGNWIVAGTYTGRIYLRRVTNPEQIIEIGTQGKRITAISFSADSKRMATGGEDGTIDLWDLGPIERYLPEANVFLPSDKKFCDELVNVGDDPQRTPPLQVRAKGPSNYLAQVEGLGAMSSFAQSSYVLSCNIPGLQPGLGKRVGLWPRRESSQDDGSERSRHKHVTCQRQRIGIDQPLQTFSQTQTSTKTRANGPSIYLAQAEGLGTMSYAQLGPKARPVGTGDKNGQNGIDGTLGQALGARVDSELRSAENGPTRRIPQLIRSIKAHAESVKSITFSKDGKRLVSMAARLGEGNPAGTAKLWDMNQLNPEYVIGEYAENRYDADFGIVFKNAKQGVEVVSLPQSKSVATDGNENVQVSIEIGDRLVGISDSADATPIDLTEKDEVDIQRLVARGALGSAAYLHFDREGTRTAIELTRNKKLAPSAMRLAYSTDGRSLAIADAAHGATLWSLDTMMARRLPFFGFSVAFTPDGRFLAMDNEKEVVLWDVASDRVHAQFDIQVSTGPAQANDGGASIAISPDGLFLAVGTGSPFDARSRKTTELSVWDLSTLQRLPTPQFEKNRSTVACAFTPDGKSLVTLDVDGTLRIWTTADWSKPPRALQVGQAASMALSPDGGTIAVGRWDGKIVSLWDFESGKQIRVLGDHVAFGLSFSPDGQSLVSSGFDNNLVLWNVKEGTPVRSFGGHNAFVAGVAFSPDGTTLATADNNGTLRLWQAKRLPVIDRHPDTIRSMFQLGRARIRHRRFSESESILRHTLYRQQAALTNDHDDITATRRELVRALRGQGKLPVFQRHPTSIKVAQGGRAQFSATIDGDGPWAYQWMHNGQAVAEANESTFTVPKVQVRDYGRYSVQVRPLGDNDVIASQSEPAFLVDPNYENVAPGLMWERYDEINGSRVHSFTTTLPFRHQPDARQILDALEIPANVKHHYGGQVTGLLTPPQTGDYVFYLCSSDNCEFYLSTTDLPNDRQLIAKATTHSGSRKWESLRPESISKPIQLVAGQRYWLEVLFKENYAGDHLAITWQRPDQRAPKNGDAPISREFLKHRGE